MRHRFLGSIGSTWRSTSTGRITAILSGGSTQELGPLQVVQVSYCKLNYSSILALIISTLASHTHTHSLALPLLRSVNFNDFSHVNVLWTACIKFWCCASKTHADTLALSLCLSPETMVFQSSWSRSFLMTGISRAVHSYNYNTQTHTHMHAHIFSLVHMQKREREIEREREE